VLVVDDTVATGSINLSRNATRNAENGLIFTAPEVAETHEAAIARAGGRLRPARLSDMASACGKTFVR
jgi:phosphatidylserine/phosphatidylglycerophosphate/cardiolipin synthase-like enzyme